MVAKLTLYQAKFATAWIWLFSKKYYNNDADNQNQYGWKALFSIDQTFRIELHVEIFLWYFKSDK